MTCVVESHAQPLCDHASSVNPRLRPRSSLRSRCPQTRAIEDLVAFDNAVFSEVFPMQGRFDDGHISSEPPVNEHETPAKKKRRSGSPVASAASSATKCAGRDLMSPGASPSDKEKGDALCPGCGRNRESTCYVVPSGTVAWAFKEGAGKWCKDCFSVWRTNYSLDGATSLTFMGDSSKTPCTSTPSTFVCWRISA